MENNRIKYKGFFERSWADPVWSKVISVGIITFITLIYTFFKTILADISFADAFINILNFEIKVYVYLIIFTCSILLYYIIFRIRKYKNEKIIGFDIEQKVGNFTFRELYNALLTHKIATPINLMGPERPKEIDLLAIFSLYIRIFNQGVEWQHDNNTYYLYGPLLMSYGIIEKVPTTNKLDTIGSDMIQTSKIGFEFYAMLEKWRIYNEETIDEDLDKIKPNENTEE
jgi:hypothetical protein